MVIAGFAGYQLITTHRERLKTEAIRKHELAIRDKIAGSSPNVFVSRFTDRTLLPVERDFPGVRVKTMIVELSKEGALIKVATLGIADVPVAPRVEVSLFDEEGRQLARGLIVGHTSADLAPNANDVTEDSVEFLGEPVYLAVRAEGLPNRR